MQSHSFMIWTQVTVSIFYYVNNCTTNIYLSPSLSLYIYIYIRRRREISRISRAGRYIVLYSWRKIRNIQWLLSQKKNGTHLNHCDGNTHFIRFLFFFVSFSCFLQFISWIVKLTSSLGQQIDSVERKNAVGMQYFLPSCVVMGMVDRCILSEPEMKIHETREKIRPRTKLLR